jgi:hypothetical protein
VTIVLSGLINITYGQVNETYQSYENRDIGLRLSYPSDWGKIVVDPGCQKETTCFLSSEGTNATHITFRFGLLAAHKEICDCNSLTEFVRNKYKSDEQGMKAFSFINDNQTTVGKKYPSWQYEFSFLNDANVNTKSLNVLTTNNETYFALVIFYPIESQAKLLPQFKKVIDSIEFFPGRVPVAKTPSFMNMNETGESIPETNIDNNLHGLQILSHNLFTDSAGYMHVVGEIKNNYPSAATFVKIIGTFYDINDRVVATDFTYTNPSDIAPGDKAPFELILSSASVPTSLIDHYSLRATYQ